MSRTKLIAVAVVAILAVTAVGVYLLIDRGAGDESDADAGRLMVYGNVNDDDLLDQNDLEALRAIIAGDKKATRYADVNQDGVIDQKDIAMLERMIDREPMDIYYDYPYDGKIHTAKIAYPVETACIVGTNALIAMKAIGAVDKILCINGGTVDATLYSDYAAFPRVSDSVFKANLEEVSLRNPQAIITLDAPSYLDNYAEFQAAGIDVIRISASDGIDSIAGYITLGYLLGCEERANSYAAFCDGIVDHIGSKVGTGAMADRDRVTALSVTMSNYVSGTSSDYFMALKTAGARNVADWDEKTKRFNPGDEWLLEEKCQADFIIHFRSLGYGAIDVDEEWGTYSTYFTEMDAFRNGNYVIINANMPVPLRLAYAASVLYPDLIGSDYGERMHQEFIDGYVDNLSAIGYDVGTDGVFLITADMIGA
jgi:iron complex transport system substrate-binding protein